MADVDMSHWIHSTPRPSTHRPSGHENMSPFDVALLGALQRWITRHHEVVPGKGLAAEVAVFLPANDVALCVVGTGLAASTAGWLAPPRLLLLVSVV